MFAPAGSFRFWQGWIYLGIFVAFSVAFCLYFYKRDPALLERRLQNREPRRVQRIFKLVWVPLWLCTLMLPGFDHRFGWSAALAGGIPAAISAIALAAIVVSWIIVIEVIRWNRFASSVVQVQAGQKVISDGPYRRVRHPMYSGFALMVLATPFALGSYVALAPAVLLMPVLLFRLRDEEQFLRQELPGYAEYCRRTRYRLLPYLF